MDERHVISESPRVRAAVSLYDAAFVGAVGTVADRATARVVRTLAYKGES